MRHRITIRRRDVNLQGLNFPNKDGHIHAYFEVNATDYYDAKKQALELSGEPPYGVRWAFDLVSVKAAG